VQNSDINNLRSSVKCRPHCTDAHVTDANTEFIENPMNGLDAAAGSQTDGQTRSSRKASF
jgi:hypothetical protein